MRKITLTVDLWYHEEIEEESGVIERTVYLLAYHFPSFEVAIVEEASNG